MAVKEILHELTALGESGLEVFYFIPEPRKFVGVKKLSENIRKPWLMPTLKEIKNIINNQILLVEDQNEGEPVTPCMDVYKAKVQADGSKIVVLYYVDDCVYWFTNKYIGK